MRGTWWKTNGQYRDTTIQLYSQKNNGTPLREMDSAGWPTEKAIT
jgi:hypothetical protein